MFGRSFRSLSLPTSLSADYARVSFLAHTRYMDLIQGLRRCRHSHREQMCSRFVRMMFCCFLTSETHQKLYSDCRHFFTNCLCVSTFAPLPQLPATFIHAPFSSRICSAVHKFIRCSGGPNIWQLLGPRGVHPLWGNKAWTPAPPCRAKPLVCVVSFRASVSCVQMP